MRSLVIERGIHVALKQLGWLPSPTAILCAGIEIFTVIRLPGEDDGPVISSKARKILVMYSVDRRAGIVRRKWLRTLQRGEAEFAVGNVFRSTSFPGFVNAGRLLI